MPYWCSRCFCSERNVCFVTGDKIMTGSNYILSRQAFRILHEAGSRLRFTKFKQQQQHHQIYSLFSTIIQNIENSFGQTCEHEEITGVF